MRILNKRSHRADTQKGESSLAGAGVSKFGGRSPWGIESDFSEGMLNPSFGIPERRGEIWFFKGWKICKLDSIASRKIKGH